MLKDRAIAVFFIFRVVAAWKTLQNGRHFLLDSALKAATWQEDLDRILDVDTPCDIRRDVAKGFLQKFSEISNDVISAVQEQNIEKIAPKSSSYGKAVAGFQAFQNQLISDVIPDLLTKGVPKLVDEGPKLINQLLERGPTEIVESGQKAINTAREIAGDASLLQSTVDDLRREMKNIVKSTPEGLQTPVYEVLSKNDEYEIRKYAPYSVCTTNMANSAAVVSDPGAIPVEPFLTSNSFNTLAKYVFGENMLDGRSEKLSMTTPVITDATSMSFVLPRNYDSMSAPIPTSEEVVLKDLPSEIVAVREFSGLVTEGEISRQKAKLEDALIAAGMIYDSASFKVLQYNPPYTLPWVRRNEICVNVNYTPASSGGNGSADDEYVSNAPDRATEDDESAFFAAPEAGD
jgi:hypothetical protein